MHTRAVEFGQRVDQVKAEVEGPPWGWYPWKMLPEFIVRFDAMLTGENRSVLDRPAGTRVADIGAADGDFSFFLESIGFKVDIVDGGAGEIKELRLQPPTILKRALGSSVE
ncbi:MAG: tRNA (mo5U34)-methyltransferase, partial [Solirubrobacteraceae bacterium]|nr:tRNA (mo5U34)-methyltransferase [Solirubrobacteraceae bacterium]